jgi:molecular chaperone DnaK
VEKTLKEQSDRLLASDRARVESAIDEARQAARGEDLQAIKQSVSVLKRVSQLLAEAGQNRSGQSAESDAGSSDVSEGEVINAEPVQANNRT